MSHNRPELSRYLFKFSLQNLTLCSFCCSVRWWGTQREVFFLSSKWLWIMVNIVPWEWDLIFNFVQCRMRVSLYNLLNFFNILRRYGGYRTSRTWTIFYLHDSILGFLWPSLDRRIRCNFRSISCCQLFMIVMGFKPRIVRVWMQCLISSCSILENLKF